jgi:hypothetical protein
VIDDPKRVREFLIEESWESGFYSTLLVQCPLCYALIHDCDEGWRKTLHIEYHVDVAKALSRVRWNAYPSEGE